MRLRVALLLVVGGLVPATATTLSAQDLEGQVHVGADVTPDPHGISAEIRPDLGPHTIWVADRLFRHSILFDGDTGNALGMVDTTWSIGGITPYTSHTRSEFYVLEPIYAHGNRGKRTDYVTIYDAQTLEVSGDIELPTLKEETAHSVALSDVLDDERFLVITNMIPASSVTVVDLAERRFVAEIETAGCTQVYPVGARRFGMLCGDGTAIAVDLDDDGKLSGMKRSKKFFNAVDEPVSDKGTRDAKRWLFASFDGYLHEVDFEPQTPQVTDRWSLTTERERNAGWRSGGKQHLAVHTESRRLYALMHKGGPGSHKDPGHEIWTFDLDERKRVGTIDVPSLLPAFLRPVLEIPRESLWHKFLKLTLPNLGAHSIVVTQDTEALLFVRHDAVGAIGVVDAASGQLLSNIEESGISGGLMTVP
jgi:methylamine dehydrogenase heavy chain